MGKVELLRINALMHALRFCIFCILAVCRVSIASPETTKECKDIKGIFLVRGELTWWGTSSGQREVYFLDVASDGIIRLSGSYFELQFNGLNREMTATVFDSQSQPFFNKKVPAN